MLYMIIEHFRDGDAIPVYRRFRDKGRLAPAGLEYVSSWITADLTRCYQVMECADRTLLEQWIAQWQDLVDFEVVPVVTSAEAATSVGGRLLSSTKAQVAQGRCAAPPRDDTIPT